MEVMTKRQITDSNLYFKIYEAVSHIWQLSFINPSYFVRLANSNPNFTILQNTWFLQNNVIKGSSNTQFLNNF